MNSLNMATIIIVVGCLLMLWFANWWNKHHDK
jgi:hypothetical protein